MNIRTFATIFILAVMALLTSCGTPEVSDGRIYFMDIVTLESANESGATMTFRKEGDSPLITLTSNQKFNLNDFKEGTRILIQYWNVSNQRYISGPINITSAINIEGEGKAALWSSATATQNWASSPVSLSLVWRAGEYLNLEFDAVTNGAPQSCSLFIDSETKDTECPHLHLVFDATPGSDARTYRVYGSWNIEELWNNPRTKSIRVYAADTSLNPAYITITKENTNV